MSDGRPTGDDGLETPDQLTISVLVPTRDRADSLAITLAALARRQQPVPSNRFQS